MSEEGSAEIISEHMKTGFLITLVLVVLCFAIVLFVSHAVNREVDIGGTVNEIYSTRLLYEDSCLGFNDGIRTHIGIIDAKKMDTKRLNKCFYKKEFSAKLTLAYNNKVITAYNNEDAFVLDSRLCFSSRYRCGLVQPVKHVAVFDNDVVYPGVLNVSAVYYGA